MTTLTDYFPLLGGEDLITAPISVKPGRLLLSLNYDCHYNGGYRRMDGLERYDGRTAPSAAVFYGVMVEVPGAMSWTVGDTITGASGSAEIISIVMTSAAQGPVGTLYVVTFLEAVTFADDESISNGSQAYTAFMAGAALQAGSDDQLDFSINAAAEAARALITEVPGTGPVTGVWQFNGVRYAVRDSTLTVGAATLYRSTAAGWTAVSLGRYVNFNSGGTTEIIRGDVLTGATSGATATVVGVVLTSGDWAAGTATGRLYVRSETGSFTGTENINAPSQSNIASFVSYTNNSLLAGGYYRTVKHNFFATSGGEAIYGTNGVGKAFYFDGTTFGEIVTGSSIDIPLHIAVHGAHLALSFPGGSLQVSGDANPFDWTSGGGTAEFGAGEEITGLVSDIAALVVYSRNHISILYGTSVSDFEFKPHSDETGAVDKTALKMGRQLFLDDRGMTQLSTTQEYGNFVGAQISTDIEPILRPKHGLVATTAVVRSKNLYRFFFNDGTGISAGFRANKIQGFTQFRLPVQAYVAHSSEDTDGTERVFIGAEDGFVYEMEKSSPYQSSFDGEDIPAYLRPVFNHNKSPRLRKRYKLAVLEIEAPRGLMLRGLADFSFASGSLMASVAQNIALTGGGMIWGTKNWGEFEWGGQVVPEMRLRIDGTGTNVGLWIDGSGNKPPHILKGCTLHYSPRRLER